jgi:hypothetical protein
LAKDPAILWYWDNWFTGTMLMTKHQKGCYMDLLGAQFNNGHLSLEEIKTILGADFGPHWPTLQKKFKADESGLFYNERMDVEVNKRAIYKPKKIAAATLAGLLSSTKNLTKEQKSLIKSKFKIDDFLEDPNQNVTKWFNQMVNDLDNYLGNGNINRNIEDNKSLDSKKSEEEIPKPDPLGSEIVQKAAKVAFDNTIWVENTCMANSLNKDDLKRWMAKYNASLCNDTIAGFDDSVYRKMFGGWLSSQFAKGYKLPPKEQSNSFTERTKTYEVRR